MEHKELGGLALYPYWLPKASVGGLCKDLIFHIEDNMVTIPIDHITHMEIGHDIECYFDNRFDNGVIVKKLVIDKSGGISGLYLYIYSDAGLCRIYKLSNYDLKLALIHNMKKDILTNIILDETIEGRDCWFNAKGMMDLDRFSKNGYTTVITRDEDDLIQYISRDKGVVKHHTSYINSTTFDLEIGKYQDIKTISIVIQTESFNEIHRKISNISITEEGKLKGYTTSYDNISKSNTIPSVISNVLINRFYTDDKIVEVLLGRSRFNGGPEIRREFHKYNGKYYITKSYKISEITDPYDPEDHKIQSVTVVQYLYGKNHELTEVRKYCKVTKNLYFLPNQHSKGYMYSKPVTLFKKYIFEIGDIEYRINYITDDPVSMKVFGKSLYSYCYYYYTDIDCVGKYARIQDFDRYFSISIHQRVFGQYRNLDVYTEDIMPTVEIGIDGKCIGENHNIYYIVQYVQKILKQFVQLLKDRFSSDAVFGNPTYSYAQQCDLSYFLIIRIRKDYIKYRCKTSQFFGSVDCHLEKAVIRQVEEGTTTTNLYFDAQELKLNYYATDSETGFTNLLSTTLNYYSSLDDLKKQRDSMQKIFTHLFKVKYDIELV